MFRFYKNSPYVTAAMSRMGLSTFAELAIEAECNVLEVLDWLNDAYIYPEVTTDMIVFAVVLNLRLTDMVYVDDQNSPDPVGDWQRLNALEADVIATHF